MRTVRHVNLAIPAIAVLLAAVAVVAIGIRMRSLLLDRGNNPTLSWDGDPAVGQLLATLWDRFHGEREQRRIRHAAGQASQTPEGPPRRAGRNESKWRPEFHGPDWKDMEPYLDPTATYDFYFVPYAEPVYMLLPARPKRTGPGMVYPALIGSKTGTMTSDAAPAILDALAELHGRMARG